MYRPVLAIAISTAMALTTANAYAVQKGQGPKMKTTAGQSAPKGPKVQAQGGSKVQGGGKVQAKGQTKTTGPKTTKTQTAKGGPKKTTTSSATVATTGSKKTTTTTPATTETTQLTPVQQKLQRNENLASKLSGRLPQGTDLMTAAEGFRNLGQFVAAVNVSSNLGISFTDLKTRMVDDGMSLGQAIKAERNDVNATTVARQAEADATRLINETEGATSTKKTKGTKKNRG